MRKIRQDCQLDHTSTIRENRRQRTSCCEGNVCTFFLLDFRFKVACKSLIVFKLFIPSTSLRSRTFRPFALLFEMNGLLVVLVFIDDDEDERVFIVFEFLVVEVLDLAMFSFNYDEVVVWKRDKRSLN